jgi:hypothetical protein
MECKNMFDPQKAARDAALATKVKYQAKDTTTTHNNPHD